MAKLEELKAGQQITGIIPHQSVTIVDVKWHGRDAVELFYKRADGRPGTQLLFRQDEASLTVSAAGRTWSFAGDGDRFRLVAEAYRIHLAHLFDPVLAVHTSLIEPLPHQITAVYGEMLSRQPLRYLLADDPGAGKTIMAGLLIKELTARGDVRRCLICAPGSLATQWQDELWFKFQLPFEILSRDSFDTAVSGNPFLEKDLAIIRLDQIARNDGLQEKLRRSDWDLVIVDEAHKMSASFWGGELKVTRRYRLGQLLGSVSRHLLLMTATPHNGKEEDFQLFLALLDPDRFEGRFREGVHQVDVTDIMRRMVKERLLRFDGRRLFPERRAYTVNYALSAEEMALYNAVTNYVREEFDRAEQLRDDRRKGNVGFALIVLQRRLASSPEAIYRSLTRRRERLEKRLAEVTQVSNLPPVTQVTNLRYDDDLSDVDWDDYDDAPAEEAEALEEEVMDAATAALTIAELQAEIETLRRLEETAFRVRQSGRDRKWEQLASLLQDDEHMTGPDGARRKLVIFTEHRDTLRYLQERITTLFGRDENIVHIDGRLKRDERRAVEDRFRNDPDVHFLVATDAAGEGINLQRAHLMINYDLPWNPNRLEQRFGRIHRIGQTEVCHLWNLVAGQTREGMVYERLLRKLETESKALNGELFDILGALFEQAPLRQLLVEAVRYGDQPDVRERLTQVVDNTLDRERARRLLETRALTAQTMDISQIERIRADMERYAARRLQPHYIRSFFLEAFTLLGGALREREPGRYRVTHVPAVIRDYARAAGAPLPVLRQYERICFDKRLINPPGRPLAQFICPGHPLLDAVIGLLLEQQREALRGGAILVDETDPGVAPRVLFFLEQAIRDAGQRLISREVHFLEIDEQGQTRAGGGAPYLDYRPATADERSALTAHLEAEWLRGETLESQVIGHAITALTPRHLERVRRQREELIGKTAAAVQERLTKEINYWDRRAAELRQQEQAGQPHRRLNAKLAQQRADELAARLARRQEELALERQIAAAPPLIIGGALVVPAGLLLNLTGLGDLSGLPDLRQRQITEAVAMKAVTEAEIALGNHPRDVSGDNLGYDIESLDPGDGRLRFIEVKGRRAGAETVTVTRNEILTAVNSAEQYILALVEVAGSQAQLPRYLRRPFSQEPEFGVTSINYNLTELLARSERPA
jgi:superfamily II DNA or RNA helicase